MGTCVSRPLADAAEITLSTEDPPPIPPLLAFLDQYPGLFAAEVLPRLGGGDRAVLAQVARPLLTVIAAAATVGGVASALPRAGKSEGVPLKLEEFLGSAERLAWAKSNGCEWTKNTCACAAKGGHLEALRWAREQGCPWHAWTCTLASAGGHLAVLQWAREHGCPWDSDACKAAAQCGHMEVLQWLREHDCPWDEGTCACAAYGGHLAVLQWAREHGCEW